MTSWTSFGSTAADVEAGKLVVTATSRTAWAAPPTPAEQPGRVGRASEHQQGRCVPWALGLSHGLLRRCGGQYYISFCSGHLLLAHGLVLVEHWAAASCGHRDDESNIANLLDDPTINSLKLAFDFSILNTIMLHTTMSTCDLKALMLNVSGFGMQTRWQQQARVRTGQTTIPVGDVHRFFGTKAWELEPVKLDDSNNWVQSPAG